MNIFGNIFAIPHTYAVMLGIYLIDTMVNGDLEQNQ